MHDTLGELKALSPNATALEEKPNRRITVEVRAWICDAPMRALLKGIVGHGGFYGCERCVTRGKSKPMHFPDCDCDDRIQENFLEYMEKDAAGKAHKHHLTPLDGLVNDMVSKFIVQFNTVFMLFVHTTHCWLL